METEAKYRVPDPAPFEQIAALRQLGTYELQPHPAIEQQHNRYYDTADGRLAAARYGLRLRQIGERKLITLKGPNSVENGLHRRAEWEFAHDDPDPTTWPPGEAREQALAIMHMQPLQCLLTIDTTRRVIDALHNGQPVAELSLDEGLITAGERRAPLCEIEIELRAGGSLQDLAAIASALGHYAVMEPEPTSKLERGLALLRSNL